MSQEVHCGNKSFTAGAAIAQYLRVKISSGKLAVAGVGASDETVEIGTVTRPAFADGDPVDVRLRNAQGTRKCVAAGAITAGAAFYGAAAGKISATSSGAALGIAMEASAADNDVIEVLYY